MITATHFHAMVIHFPIALIMAGFFSEILGLVIKKEFFKNVAIFLLILGALGAIVAFISGNMAGEGIEEGPLKAPLDLHETDRNGYHYGLLGNYSRISIGYILF